MSSILNTPQEIFYLIAQYGLDLLDLGALIWSCKTLNERIGQDLPLQKFFLDNTPPMLRGCNTFVRKKFIASKTAYGIRCNDPDGVLMSFPKLTPTEILKVLKVANLKVVRDMNRRVITDDIYNADADKVLDFIIKNVIENATPEEKDESIVEVLSLFFGSYFTLENLTSENPSIYTKYLDSIKTKKIIAVLLKHFQEQQSVWYGNLLVSCSASPSWCNSYKSGFGILTALVKLSTTFPGFKIDFHAPITSKYFLKDTPIPPLEFCISRNALDCFQLLKKHGVKLEKDAPYLPLALYHNKLNTTHLAAEFLSGKFDINAYLPGYRGFNPGTTILGHTLALGRANGKLDSRDHCFIEMLLSHGAKMTKEEEKQFLSLDPTHWAHKAAVLQQQKDYFSIPRLVAQFPFGNQDSVAFCCPEQGTLHVYKTGEFKLEIAAVTYMGFWKDGNKKGTLVCRSNKRRTVVDWGSYGYGGTQEEPNSQAFNFHVFRMYDDTVTVMRDNVPQNSFREMWRMQP